MGIITEDERQSDITTRAAWRAAKLPECLGRIDSAVKLGLAGDVELLVDGTAKVFSASNGVSTYSIVNGHCDCRDFAQAPHGYCKHRLSAAIARRAAELVPAQEQDPLIVPPAIDTTTQAIPVSQPAPALPEAPVSITLKAHLHGHEVLVTLRGVDFVSVKTQVEEASAWLQAQTPAHTTRPEQAPAEETPVCKYHGPMKVSTKAPGTWYCASKMGDGSYCKERYPQA